MIKLRAGEKLVLNKALTANQPVNAKAYIEGNCEAQLEIIGEVDGVIDTDTVQLNNDSKVLNVQGNATILENVRVEMSNNGVDTEATATIVFTSGLELTFTAVGLGAKGNDIVIAFESGAERGVEVDYGSNLITITFTYESGDNANNLYDYFKDVESTIVIANGERVGTISEKAPKLNSQNIHEIIVFNNDIYGTTSGGMLYKYNDTDGEWEQVAPQLDSYLPRFLVICNGELYANCVYNDLLKYNQSAGEWEHVVNAITASSRYFRPFSFNGIIYAYDPTSTGLLYWNGVGTEWNYGINPAGYPDSRLYSCDWFIIPEGADFVYLINYTCIYKFYPATSVVTQYGSGFAYSLNLGYYNENVYVVCNYTNTKLIKWDEDEDIWQEISDVNSWYSRLIVYKNRIYKYNSGSFEYLDNSNEFQTIDGRTFTSACIHGGELFLIYGGILYGYHDAYSDDILDDQSEQMSGGFTPELQISKIIFNGESLPNQISPADTDKAEINTIRKLSLFDLVNGKTVPVQTTDKEITFHKEIYSTVDKKEDIGIEDKNLIEQVSEFPADPDPGQIVVKDGKSYIYKETT